MLLSVYEGCHWRYEICEHPDGYLVRMRDLVTGELDADFAVIFRTLPVAFAYAEMSAAFERFAAAGFETTDDDPAEGGVAASEAHFVALSDRLQDRGVDDLAAQAWSRPEARPRPAPEPRVLH